MGLLVLTRLIEPHWGRREVLKLISIVNASAGVCVFCILIATYFATQSEFFLCGYSMIGFFGTVKLVIRYTKIPLYLNPIYSMRCIQVL